MSVRRINIYVYKHVNTVNKCKRINIAEIPRNAGGHGGKMLHDGEKILEKMHDSIGEFYKTGGRLLRNV